MVISKQVSGCGELGLPLGLQFIAMFLGAVLLAGCATSVDRPGPRADGSILLPNRWSLTPAGQQIPVGDLPLAMALTPDDRWLVVANNGYADQYVSVIDLAQRQEIAQLPMEESWLGLTFDSQGNQLFVSGGGSDSIEMFDFNAGFASPRGTLQIKDETDERPFFVAGLAVSPDDRTLLACALRQNKLAVFDLADPGVPEFIDVGAYPYAVVINAAGDTAYVSNWGGQSISVVDLSTRKETLRIPVGDHPNAMVLSQAGDRLYVANANSNELFVIDTTSNEVRQILDLSPYEGAPRGGATPNGINLSADGGTLYLVSADNNSLTVIDVRPDKAEIKGSIPTGWYPTDVKSTRDLQTLIVTNGKGLASAANPQGPQPTESIRSGQYIGELFPGTVSLLKTIELILGLPPMSQYDAAAIPLFTAFQDEADMTPYRVRPNQWPLDELNPVGGYGADLSMEMNFDEVDATPELILNEIIWKSVKGSASVMPRPHTRRNWIGPDDD